MKDFFVAWGSAAFTSLGLFWMALWAFVLGYVISSMIQVFVTRKRMREAMGTTGAKSVGLGTFFGFISSSCSFAALATTRALFAKGAGLIPALAFMLASTNLVIELGIIIAVFLSWQFVAGEYVGGVLLILFMWVLVKLTLPQRLEEEAREHARSLSGHDHDSEDTDWRSLMVSAKGWHRVARTYVMEWDMVWKDVTIGFTVAGVIAVFVPRAFFQALFIGSGGGPLDFLEVLAQSMIGPVAAFFTFIGSMGNIPLAAVLFGNGVSFAGVMAFMFSDLVVFPVLRVQAKYYGWRMAAYILAVLYAILVATAVLMHYVLDWFDALPDGARLDVVTDRAFFAVDYTLVLNVLGIAVSLLFLFWKRQSESGGMDHGSATLGERLLTWLARLAFAWLIVGLGLRLFVS